MEKSIDNNLKEMILSASYIDTIVESLLRIRKGLCHIKNSYKEDNEDSLDKKKHAAGLDIEVEWDGKRISSLRDALYEIIIKSRSEKKEITDEKVNKYKNKIYDLMKDIRGIVFEEIVQKVIQKDGGDDDVIIKAKQKLIHELHILRTKIFELKKYIHVEGQED